MAIVKGYNSIRFKKRPDEKEYAFEVCVPHLIYDDIVKILKHENFTTRWMNEEKDFDDNFELSNLQEHLTRQEGYYQYFSQWWEGTAVEKKFVKASGSKMNLSDALSIYYGIQSGGGFHIEIEKSYAEEFDAVYNITIDNYDKKIKLILADIEVAQFMQKYDYVKTRAKEIEEEIKSLEEFMNNRNEKSKETTAKNSQTNSNAGLEKDPTADNSYITLE